MARTCLHLISAAHIFASREQVQQLLRISLPGIDFGKDGREALVAFVNSP